MASAEHTVFILDDDDAVRRAVGLLVQSSGRRVRSYRSAREFLASYRGETGCLLLDLHMPEMDGVELQRALGEHGHRLPVIAITAHPDDGLAREARRLGARAVLGKPFRDHELLEHIAGALGG